MEKLADDDSEKPRKRPRTERKSKTHHSKGDDTGGSDGNKSDPKPKKSKKDRKDKSKRK